MGGTSHQRQKGEVEGKTKKFKKVWSGNGDTIALFREGKSQSVPVSLTSNGHDEGLGT